MIKTMRAYKLELGDTDEVQKKFAQDMTSIKEAAWKNHGNLTGNDKGAFTRVEHKVDAIKSDASGLYNNVNVNQVEQISKEAVNITDNITAAQNRNAQATKDAIERQKQLSNAAGKAAKEQVDGYKNVEKEATKYVSIQDQIKNGFDSLGRGAKQILSVTTTWRSLKNVVKSTFNDIKGLDKAFANIAMVTSYSVKDLWGQYDQYAEMANKLGQSTQSVIEASGLYYQQGLKTNEVLKLTEETMKLATLAGLDFKEATSQMTAALRAFHMDMSEGAHVTDVYAEVAAHAAVDVQGLSEAMSATAAIANSAGMSFENTTAMLATMVEATQEAPKNLGTAMKTILARFTELKTNVAGTADSEFDDLDYNKVDKALKSVGVNIKDATGQFRNMDEVLLELSSKWKGLDRNSQRYIATIAAGSRQQSRFIALMENYERTMELVDVAQNSAGRSSQQFAKYQDTVEYRLKKIQNTWEQFRTNMLTSDFYKDLLDNFGDFLKKINDMSSAELATLAATWLTAGRRAIGGTIEVVSSGVGKAFSGVGKKSTFIQNYQATHENATGEEASAAYEDAKVEGSKKGYAIGNIIATSITAAVTSGLTQDDPWKAVGTAFQTSLIPNIINGFQVGGPQGAVAGAALSAITGIVSGIVAKIKSDNIEREAKKTSNMLKAAEKELERVEARANELRSQQKGNESEIESLEKIEKEYNKLKNKQYLTVEEQEEFNELVKTLQSDYPELINIYDEENNKLEISTKLLQEKIDKTKELQKETEKSLTRETATKAIASSVKEVREGEEGFYKKLIETDSGNGFKYSENEAKVFYEKASKYSFDKTKVEDIINEIKEYYDIEDDSLFEGFRKVFEEYSFKDINYKDLFKETSKNIIDNSDNEQIKNINEQAKDSLSLVLNNQIQKDYKQIEEDLLDFSKEYSDLSDKQREKTLDNIIKQGNEAFKEKYTSQDLNNIINLLSNNADWDSISDTTREQLKGLLGITTEEDYKTFNKSYSSKTAKIQAVTQSFAGAAIGSNELTEEQIQQTIALDNQLQNIYKTDKNIKEIEQDINAIREKYTFAGAEDVIDKYDKEREDYDKFLQNYNIKDTSWANLSVNKGNTVKENLSDYLEQFKSPSMQKEVAEALYESIEKSGLQGKGLEALYDINYVDLSKMSFNEATEEIAKKLEAADPKFKDVGKKYAKQILNGLTDKGLVSFIQTSADTLTKSIQEKLDANTDYIKTYGEVINKYLSDVKNVGHIDMSNIKDLRDKITSMDLEPEKFIRPDLAGNYQLDYEGLLQAAKDQLGTEDEFVEKKKEEQRLGVQQLDLEIQLLTAEMNGLTPAEKKLDIEKEITEQKYQQAVIEGRATAEVNAAIEQARSTTTNNDDYKTALQQRIDGLKEQRELLNKDIDKQAREEYRAQLNYFDDLNKDYKKGLEDIKKDQEKAYKDWIDKTKAVTDTQKSLAKAIEAVTEKQKELKAVIEGTNWKSSVDGMYNYNTALDFLTKQTERAKKNFDKVSSISEAKNNFQIYGQGLLDQKTQLAAQNQTYRTAYNNIGKVYNNDVAKLIKSFEDSGQMKFNLADYLVFDEKTGTKINMNALQRAKMPEALKKWIETQGQKANEYLGKILDNEDKIDQINEEFLEQQRKARDEYISLQDQMMDVLREKYQQEIDDLQNKYDTMNEADNKYLESLQKNLDRQRKLRDQEKNWNDLTNKERKLSLMQRDTSGGNLADVKNLQNEIEDQRTQLLDDAVDQIIEKLTEFYELQKETRDAEIEYKQTLIDDVALLKEATEALEKIQTSDDLVNWWKENVTGIEAFSEQKLGKLTEDWNKLFDAKSNYVASIDDKMKESIKDANGHLKEVGDQAEEIVRTTSEGITNLAEQSLQEAGEEYKKAVKTAKDALQDAVDAVAKQKEALQAAINAANESKKAFDDIHAKYIEYLNQQKVLNRREIVQVNDIVYEYGKAQTEAARLAREGKTVNVTTPKTVSTDSKEYQNATNNSKPVSTSVDAKWNYKTINLKDANNRTYNNAEWSTYMGQTKGMGTGSDIKVDIPRNIDHGLIIQNEKDKTKWEYIKTDKTFKTREEAEKYLEELKRKAQKDGNISEIIKHNKNLYRAFAEGGLVNYTGPAWVDGSRSRPEAFLSSEDTRRIGEAARILADLPILSQPVKEQIPTTTIGDTTIQIDVHVDSIANDYDLDEAMNKVEQRIVNAAKYAGSNVILKKH